MFSRKMILLILGIFLLAISFTVMTMGSRQSLPVSRVEQLIISLVSPVQSRVNTGIEFTQDVWSTYFMAVLAVEENEELHRRLSGSIQMQNRYEELVLENERLRKFVNFTGSVRQSYIAAQVVARDPSPFFKTIMIDKGEEHGLSKGNPVMVSEGVVGQIIEVSDHHAKVLLITDRNSAVDGLIQSTRVRGIVKGDSSDHCFFVYALKKEDIEAGQVIVSSGLDRVFPKGLKIGAVLSVEKKHSQLFQKIIIQTSVNFDKLEEVLVFIDTSDDVE